MTGLDEIFLAGDGDEIRDSLSKALARYLGSGEEKQRKTVRVLGSRSGRNTVAAGAAFSALKFLFASRDFPMESLPRG